MRELMVYEIADVVGGTNAIDAARNTCTNNNLPSNTQVTISIGTTGSLGYDSTNVGTSTSVTITTTCGDLTGKPDFSNVVGKVS